MMMWSNVKRSGYRTAAAFAAVALLVTLLFLASPEVGGVAAQSGDTAPTVSDRSQFKNHYAAVGQAFSLTLPAADAGSGNGGPYEYILWKRGAGEFGENGLTFDAATRTVSGTPTATGTILLAYQIHDNDANRSKADSFVAETNLQITVLATLHTAPTVSDTSLFKDHYAVVEQAFSLTLPAADANSGNGGPYEYILWKRGAGRFGEKGLTFDAATRTVSGTPTATGTILLAYQIHDADANRHKADSFVAETNLQITIQTAPPLPPTVSDASLLTNHDATVGESFSLTLPAADADSGNGGPYTYILKKRDGSGDFGEYGLSFDPQTRTVSGTPTAPGTHQLTYLIHDGDVDWRTVDTFVWDRGLQITVTAPADWTAPAPAAPTVSDTSQFKNHNAPIGQTFSLTLPAADGGSGNGGPYDYILWTRGGGLFGENGLKFDPRTRVLSGTPQVPGVFRLAYQVHDGDSDRSKADSFVAETSLQITIPSLGPESDRARRSSPPPVPTDVEVRLVDGPFLSPVQIRWEKITGVTKYRVRVTNWPGERIRSVTFAHAELPPVNQWETLGIFVRCGFVLSFEVFATGDGTTYASSETYSEPVYMTTPACLDTPSNQPSGVTASETATREFHENSPAGTNVGAPITATAAEGDTVTYWMQGADSVFFNLDPATGQLTTKVGVDYDYDTKPSYTFTVIAANGRGGYASIAVTVNVTNVNQAPAFDEGATATRQMAEGSAAGTNVGLPVTATDQDGDTLTYTLSGKDAASFEIGGSTGQLTAKSGVTYDHDTKPSYSVTVEVSDGKGGTASIAVTVNVTEVNQPPAFGEGETATREFPERSAAGTSVGAAVTATDPDSDTLAYSLSGEDVAAFAIDNAGQLTTVAGVTYDHDTKPSYSVTVGVSDGKGGSASIAVTVSVTDVNRSPAFDEGETATREFPERSAAGASVGLPVTATDPDSDTLAYSLSSDDAASFAIDNAGQLTTVAGVTYDHGTKPSYSVTVGVSDGNGGTASIAVTVSVTEVNGAPVFRAVRSLPENSPAGTNAGWPVAAYDPDNDPLTYSLSGTDAASFDINAATGQLSAKAGLIYDYESVSMYSLSVTADDGRNGVTEIGVTVHLTDVDENRVANVPATGAPVITGTARVGRTLIADTSAIADANGLEMAAYRYQWRHGGGTVIAGAVNGAYRLQASDLGQTVTVRVTFTDDDGYREVLTSAATGPVAAAPTANTPATGAPAITGTARVGQTLTADTTAIADADGLDNVAYAYQWLSGGAEISGAAGDTYRAQSADAAKAITVRVAFTDDAGFQETLTSAATDPVELRSEAVAACHTAVGTLPVAVEYRGAWTEPRCRAHHNENRGRYFHFLLLEDAAVSLDLSAGTLFVSRATPENGWGSDPEGRNYDHRITVRLENGKLAYAGSSNTVTLALKAGNYTVEAAGIGNTSASFTLRILPGAVEAASEGEGGQQPESANQQSSQEENQAPAFGASIETTLSVPENSAAGTSVGSPVTAADPDEGDTLAYSLSGTDAASFDIGSSTGQITTKSGVTYDYETKSSYSLAVDVSDGKGGEASIAVTVNLANVNEAPAFAAASVTLSVPENSPAGTGVGDPVTAADPDSGDTLTYSLSGDDAASFAIGSAGQITTVSGVTYDYEAKPSYSLTVEATDAKGLSDSIAVTVNLANVAEATPVSACTTDLGALSAAALYAGAWDAADCRAHHQNTPARYFSYTPAANVSVTVTLSAGTLYVSQGTPDNGWGTAPNGTYEQRREVRRANGKLLHDGGNTVTLNLAAGTTYMVEAAGADGGTFTVSIAPQ